MIKDNLQNNAFHVDQAIFFINIPEKDLMYVVYISTDSYFRPEPLLDVLLEKRAALLLDSYHYSGLSFLFHKKDLLSLMKHFYPTKHPYSRYVSDNF